MKVQDQLQKFFSGNQFPENLLKKNITFYGGSFNPFHNGHKACIELWKRNTDPGKNSLIIIPDLNPWKKNETSTFDKRKEIINNLETELEDQTLVYSKFLFQNHSNPTIDWISIIKENFPEIKLSLLMGFDSFENFDKWKESKRLINILDSLYIASRQDDELVKAQKSDLYLKQNQKIKLYFLGSHNYEALSSTKIRNGHNKS